MTMSERLVPRQVGPDRDVHRRIKATDLRVGQRIRERREQLGWTQKDLGDLVAVTYQQLHKYERGINRVAAGRLHQLARALGVDVTWFYAGAPDSGMPPPVLPMAVSFLEDAAKLDRAQLAAVCALTRALVNKDAGR